MTRLPPDLPSVLQEIAERESCSIADICAHVARSRTPGTPLVPALRIYTLRYFQEAATEDGHHAAGHGLLFCPEAATKH